MSPRNLLHTHIHHTYIHRDKVTHRARLPSLKREKNGENSGPLTLLPDDWLNGDCMQRRYFSLATLRKVIEIYVIIITYMGEKKLTK